MDDDVRRELEAQGARLLALETVLFCLLCELQRPGQLSNAALNRLFDQADDTLTAVTLQLGSQNAAGIRHPCDADLGANPSEPLPRQKRRWRASLL
jgi:hypothetical protein